tara:strand:+ start:508 stop:894 length:387 start_codon:yes stop_codon:yes gene_type:complete
MNKIKISSNRNFGLVFFFVFLIISLWPLMYDGQIRSWSAIVAIIFLILALINSKILAPLNRLWFKFGLLLGSIISPIVMGIVFFLVVTPIGFIMKITGKDLLKNKYDKNSKSYWINREKNINSMKKQF